MPDTGVRKGKWVKPHADKGMGRKTGSFAEVFIDDPCRLDVRELLEKSNVKYSCVAHCIATL